MPWLKLKHGINHFIPSVIWQPWPQVPVTLQDLPADAIILDVGAGGRQITPQAIGIDFVPFENTRVVSDIHHLGFADDSADVVFCTGVLEHLENPSRAMRESFSSTWMRFC